MRNRFRIFGRTLAFLMDSSNPSSIHVSNAPLRSVPSVSITRSQVSARCCARVCTTRKPRLSHAAHRLPSRPNCTRSTNSEKHQESNFPQRLGPIEKYPRLPRCERSRRGIARRASEPPLWRATCPGYVPHADEQQRAFPSVDLRDGRLFIGLNLHGRSMAADCHA